MNKLLDVITTLVALISKEKVTNVANKILKTDSSKAATVLADVLKTPSALVVGEQLVSAWRKTSISSNELALMLLTASHVHTATRNEQLTELVWTGPITPFVSARRTEQALLEVINSADKNLFVTSFVAYKVPTVIAALKEAIRRGVRIAILLESTKEHGGTLDKDLITAMRKEVPGSEFFFWANRSTGFEGGKVHAKIVLADNDICLITSANMTTYAMEKNMEAGVLLKNKSYVENLSKHLWALIELDIIQHFDEQALDV
ncbi:DISARM system phospholipase D-like protein DrmC [Shewanella sp.]|uniref:DISARM system phospholipase D-like protein DrmC n=1 Tax=Shewanella sp. TaxID=50422 RepID=UPI002601815E|nr:DISARM system phospholipase D-like protein DrmC [Shewanella sp.]